MPRGPRALLHAGNLISHFPAGVEAARRGARGATATYDTRGMREPRAICNSLLDNYEPTRIVCTPLTQDSSCAIGHFIETRYARYERSRLAIIRKLFKR